MANRLSVVSAWPQRLAVAAALGLVLGAGCASSDHPDVGLESLKLTAVGPTKVIPGTTLVLTGDSFVDIEWGASTLHLVGTANGSPVDVQLDVSFVDFGTLTAAIDAPVIDSVGGDVDFTGTATVEVVSEVNGQRYKTPALNLTLQFRQKLIPSITRIQSNGVIFVNEQILVEGVDFLLGGNEGNSVARLTGCFKLGGNGPCQPVPVNEVPLANTMALSRRHAIFAFSPRIAGIEAGQFIGSVEVVNKMPSGSEAADPVDVTFDLVESQVFRVSPTSVSLGQFVNIEGGGFVGGEAGASTELDLRGVFARSDGAQAPVAMTLIPEFAAGKLVRYVMNTDDALGMAIDLRKETGTFTGTIQPTTVYQGTTVVGRTTAVTLTIAPIRQVVFLDYRPDYVEALRDFGMRAVDSRLRDRILTVVNRTYAGVNLECRTVAPTDFALYEHVELHGVDPNGLGLFGYDNSPGKDDGNLRLYDRLGGVNAVTQQDGYPGFGGVFVRSMMGFSLNPGNLTKSVAGADPVFDKIFDEFRTDRGGSPVQSSDLGGTIAPLTSGESCPAGNRKDRIACAIYVLGNLIGGTLAHEIGHSLGLANPFMDGFHNSGDEPNRLMDSGGDRPFLERAELQDLGPGVFCDDEYKYLREILPSTGPADTSPRPGCF
ncbi:MAG: hypothetical protein KBG15_04300 [Kofleriaceae bacterium]|nr:hypothetical protein [Kofleriaceae bacterium]